MPKTVKVILMGSPGDGKSAGKSSLMRRLVDPDSGFSSLYQVTIGSELGTIKKGEDRYKIWDLAGDRRFTPVNKEFYPGTEVLIYCVDLSKPINYPTILKQISEFKQSAFPTSNPPPMLLVGTKQDIDPVFAEQNFQVAKAFFGDLFSHYFSTSAKNNIGIDSIEACLTNLDTTAKKDKAQIANKQPRGVLDIMFFKKPKPDTSFEDKVKALLENENRNTHNRP